MMMPELERTPSGNENQEQDANGAPSLKRAATESLESDSGASDKKKRKHGKKRKPGSSSVKNEEEPLSLRPIKEATQSLESETDDKKHVDPSSVADIKTQPMTTEEEGTLDLKPEDPVPQKDAAPQSCAFASSVKEEEVQFTIEMFAPKQRNQDSAVCKLTARSTQGGVYNFKVTTGLRFPKGQPSFMKGKFNLHATQETVEFVRDVLGSQVRDLIRKKIVDFREKGYAEGYENNPIWNLNWDAIDSVDLSVRPGKPKDNGGHWPTSVAFSVPWAVTDEPSKAYFDPRTHVPKLKDEDGKAVSLEDAAGKEVAELSFQLSNVNFFRSKSLDNQACYTMNFQLNELTLVANCSAPPLFPSLGGGATSASGEGSLGNLHQRSFLSPGSTGFTLNIEEAIRNANNTLGTGTIRFGGSGVFSIRLTEADLKDMRGGQFSLRYVDSNQQGQLILKTEIRNPLLHKALRDFEDAVVKELVSKIDKLKDTFFSKMDIKNLTNSNEKDVEDLIRQKMVPLLKYPKARVNGDNGEEEISVGEIEDPVLRNKVKMGLNPILPAVVMDGGRSKIQVVHPVTGVHLRDAGQQDALEKMIGWDVGSCTILVCGVYLQKKGNIGFITRAKEMAFLEKEDPF